MITSRSPRTPASPATTDESASPSVPAAYRACLGAVADPQARVSAIVFAAGPGLYRLLVWWAGDNPGPLGRSLTARMRQHDLPAFMLSVMPDYCPNPNGVPAR